MDRGTAYGVFFGNLEDRTPPSDLVALLMTFIFQSTGILVIERDVKLRRSETCGCQTAHVDLVSPELQWMTKELVARRAHLAPEGLVKDDRVLKVTYYQPNILLRIMAESFDESLMRNRDPINAKAPRPVDETPLLARDPAPPAQVADGEPRTRHLVRGQRLGNETRLLEFKRGGGDYVKKHMRKHASKYVCAFLNSEGGTLMIGVDDEGVVQGIPCDHKTEDNIRIMVDLLIPHFDPPVLPQMYQIAFIPVLDGYSTVMTSCLKVVEIALQAGRCNTLYETPEGEVFIRRDGSVQGPLRPKDIQEWCHLKLGREYQEKEDILRQQIAALQAQLTALEKQQGRQAVRESNSGVCVDAASPSNSSPEDSGAKLERKSSLIRTYSKFCILL